MKVLPHSIEWNEDELTVRLIFIALIKEKDIYYTEFHIMHPEYMTYVQPAHITGTVFRMLCNEIESAYGFIKAEAKSIIEKRNETQQDNKKANAASK